MGIVDSVYKRKEKIQRQIKKEALEHAKSIACILGEQFGAKEVILYGSLIQGAYFDLASDIDLAVKGLGDKYLKAYGYCLRLSRFVLDLRVYEEMPENYRRRIDIEGRCLYAKRGE